MRIKERKRQSGCAPAAAPYYGASGPQQACCTSGTTPGSAGGVAVEILSTLADVARHLLTRVTAHEVNTGELSASPSER